MKAYIVQNKNKIEPLLEEIGEILIKNKRLNVLQKEIIADLGLRPVMVRDFSEINDDDEHIVFNDGLFFEPELLREFIKESKRLNKTTVCALKKGIFTLRTLTCVQGVKEQNDYIEYNLYYYPQKQLRNEKLEPIIFEPDENLESISLPKHMENSGKYLIPITTNSIIQINHWSNIWSANLTSVLSNLARFKKSSKLKFIFRILKNLSLNKWKLVGSMNKIGKNCDIHPTAYIEGSEIGDNVIVGAGTIIRESAIGDNSFLGNGVVVEFSVVGKNCTILNGHILYSVLYPGVFTVTHMISTSIIGSDSFIGSGVVLTDFRFDGKNITVIKEGQKIDSGNLFLGCCLGNNVYLGGGCIVAPGRIIPSNLHISLEKEKTISNILDKKQINGFRIIS